MSSKRGGTVRALLLGGPMYEPLYARLPGFESATGHRVDVVACLPHPELNAEVARRLPMPDHDIDFISTHTKYAPSQAAWLRPVDDLVAALAVSDLLPRARELATIDGQLMQVPRLLDVRLLYYRRDQFADRATADLFERCYRRKLEVPATWNDLVEVAAFLTRSEAGRTRYGFLFPGRESGLFGTFYEMLVSAGGDLFGIGLEPAFASPAGEWAADRLVELHTRRCVTPRELPDWHYDQVSAAFRRGQAAMVCDWPGSDYLYASDEHCQAAANVEFATLPMGFSGRRAGYGGCHSFAITKHARNVDGAAALLSYLTSVPSQELEARQGAIPVGRNAFAAVTRAAAGDPRAAQRWRLLTDLMDNAITIPPRFAAYPKCEDILWRALQRIMLAVVTPREGLARAAREVEIAIAGGRDP